MANYSYIRLKMGSRGRENFGENLFKSVNRTIGNRWSIAPAALDRGAATWLVTLPGTTPTPEEARRSFRAEGQDFGFIVQLRRGQVEFRHSPNMFERWAQGCVEEELSELLGVGIYHDATDETSPPGERHYRGYKSFGEYMSRNFEKPLNAEDAAYLERFKQFAPEGFW